MEQVTDTLIRLKLIQLEAGWLQNAYKILRYDEGDNTWKLSKAYNVFASAVSNYENIPEAYNNAVYYSRMFIYIIEQITRERIQSFSDIIFKKENSIPPNILYWCDIIERHNVTLYLHICEFIDKEIARFTGNLGVEFSPPAQNTSGGVEEL